MSYFAVKHGDVAQEGAPYKEQAEFALSKAIDELTKTKNMSADAALSLLMKHMPLEWFTRMHQDNWWNDFTQWLAIDPGDASGYVGDPEGNVWWNQSYDMTSGEPDGGSLQSALNDIHTFFSAHYKAGRLDPLAVALAASLADTSPVGGTEMIKVPHLKQGWRIDESPRAGSGEGTGSSTMTTVAVVGGIAIGGGLIWHFWPQISSWFDRKR